MSNYVYVIVNRINLKLYFGSHSWEGTGVDKNYYGSGTAIKRAVRKYGKDNFIVYPIKFYDTVEECRQAEEELLKKYDIANNPYCYNIKNGAIGWTSEDITGEKHPLYGKHLSAEHKKKISQAIKGENNPMYGRTGEKHPMYGRTGEKHPMYGRTLSEEHRQKMSKAQKGEKNPNYGKRGKDSHNYGRHHTEETRKKMSQAKKKVMTPLVAIQKDTGRVRMFLSQTECSRVLGIHRESVNSCLKGRLKSTGGYTFKYIEQLESGIYEGML